MKIAQRANIPPFHVMEVARDAEILADAGADILHLEVGQPSTGAPLGVREAAHHLLDNNRLGYLLALGYEPLRERIAAHYGDWYDLDLPSDRVAVTQGASGAFVTAFVACFDPGDRVAVIAPGYPCYPNVLRALGAEVVTIEVDASTRYQPTPDILDSHGPLDGLVLASPSNPTGTMLSPAELQELCEWCDANDTRLISDEIYHGLTFGAEVATAAAYSPTAVVVNSFSKYFSMTGWRLGWAVIPPELELPFERFGANAFISAPALSQMAGVAAFDCHEELAQNIARYQANRQVLLDGLPGAGLDRLAPADGAFYVYALVDHLTDDSQDLCRRWLHETGVAVTPGIDFDPGRGRGSVRFSFAGTTEHMQQAVQRLQDWHAQNSLG